MQNELRPVKIHVKLGVLHGVCLLSFMVLVAGDSVTFYFVY